MTWQVGSGTDGESAEERPDGESAEAALMSNDQIEMITWQVPCLPRCSLALSLSRCVAWPLACPPLTLSLSISLSRVARPLACPPLTLSLSISLSRVARPLACPPLCSFDALLFASRRVCVTGGWCVTGV